MDDAISFISWFRSNIDKWDVNIIARRCWRLEYGALGVEWICCGPRTCCESLSGYGTISVFLSFEDFAREAMSDMDEGLMNSWDGGDWDRSGSGGLMGDSSRMIGSSWLPPGCGEQRSKETAWGEPNGSNELELDSPSGISMISSSTIAFWISFTKLDGRDRLANKGCNGFGCGLAT